MNFPWRHHSCLESNIKSVIKILLYFQVSEQRGSYTSILSIKTYIKHGCTYNMSRNSWITVDSSADQPAVRHVKTNDWTFLAAVCSSSSSVLLGFRKFLRLRLLTKCSHVVQILDESQISAKKKTLIQCRCACRASLWMCCRRRKCIIARSVFSQLHGVVGRKQPAFPPQPPFPPRRVRAIHHLDDVPDTETQLVAFLRGEVVQRLHLNRGRPLWDSRGKTSDRQHVTNGSEIQRTAKASVFIYEDKNISINICVPPNYE